MSDTSLTAEELDALKEMVNAAPLLAMKYLLDAKDSTIATLTTRAEQAEARVEKADALALAAIGVWASFGMRSDVRHSGQSLLSELADRIHDYNPDAFKGYDLEAWWEAVHKPLKDAEARVAELEELVTSLWMHKPGDCEACNTLIGRAAMEGQR